MIVYGLLFTFQYIYLDSIVISASDDRYLVCGFDVHECPSLKLRRGVWILMIKDYQLNNIYLIKVRVQTLEHKRLLNIVSSQNTNDYCRTNDTRQRNIRSRKTTPEQIQLMKSKIYLMKNMAFRSPCQEVVEGYGGRWRIYEDDQLVIFMNEAPTLFKLRD